MITEYGFDWGNVKVERLMEREGYKALRIQCNGNEVTVYISPTGRRMRAFNKSKEMKAK